MLNFEFWAFALRGGGFVLFVKAEEAEEVGGVTCRGENTREVLFLLFVLTFGMCLDSHACMNTSARVHMHVNTCTCIHRPASLHTRTRLRLYVHAHVQGVGSRHSLFPVS